MLNTKEAARFLRVSEASIRRWSDAGLLASRRVGRRRERRFNESDLRAFLETVPAGRGAPADRVNVGGVTVQLHGHLANFYDNDQSRFRLTMPFLADGLRAGQPCFLVASGAILDEYMRRLGAERGIDVSDAVSTGAFISVDGIGSTMAAAVRYWEQAMGEAVAGGAKVIRIVGEMLCERMVFETVSEMITYEVAFNTIAARFPSVTLCAYDVREFDGQTIFDAMKAHPDLFDFPLGSFLN